MSTQPAPTYNPEPFNPIIYENLKGDTGDIDFIDNATLENCNVNDSTLTNCVFVGPIYSGPIKSKTYTIENDSGLDSAALTSVGNATNNVDLNFLAGVGSTNSTAFTIKNNNVVQHNFDLSGNATHTGNLILSGNNKSLQLNSTGGIYCGGAATTVSQQEISYLTGATSNIQTQINNIDAGAIKSENNVWSGTNQFDNTTSFNNSSTWNIADIYLTNDATIQQSNSTTANNLGITNIATSYGTSTVTTLNVGDTVSGNVLRIMPNIPSGAFNPASDANNQTIFAYGTQNTETLELSTWSTTNSAVKVKPTSVQIGAGGTTNTPTSSVICDGSNVVIQPSVKYPDNTIQNSAFTGGPAGSYTNTNITLDSNGKISAISNGTNLLAANNDWTGTNTFNTSLPTSTITPSANNQLTTKTYVDNAVSGGRTNFLAANNDWTGTNTFNTSLPTSTLTPSANNQLTTKGYVDSAVSGGGSGLLNTNNDWKGTNTFENTVETETNTYLSTLTGKVGIGTTSPSSKLDVSGNTNIISNFGTTANPTLSLYDSASTNSVFIIPNGSASAYNPIVQANDRVILGGNNIAPNSSNLSVTVWSDTNSGLKITPNEVRLGAGGTASSPSLYFQCYPPDNKNYITGDTQISGTLDVVGNARVRQKLFVNPSNPNVSNPEAGITNYYNTGALVSTTGNNITTFGNNNPVAGVKLVIDSKYGSVPPGFFSLFEIIFTVNNNTNFYCTKFNLQLYPYRLWNNTSYEAFWNLNNKIGAAFASSSYNYTDSIWAPNGRWYWTFDQNFSNLGGSQQGWLVPQVDKVNVIFGVPNTGSWTWEVSVRCLDATPLTQTGLTGWVLRFDDLNNW